MNRYVLWDIDGTLITNTPTSGSLYVDAIEQVTGVRPTRRVENPHGMTEGQLLAGILAVNEIDAGHLDAVLERLDELSLTQHLAGHRRQPTVGAHDAVRAVAERGWTNAVLTGNGPNRARYKLVAAGFEADGFDWEHSYFGHRSPTRHDLTADARTGLAGALGVIIGDTPKDGEAADSAEIPFLAVATGAFGVTELQATSARVVVADLESGLTALLDELGELERAY